MGSIKTKLDDGTPIEVDWSASGGGTAVISLPWLSEPGEAPEIEIDRAWRIEDENDVDAPDVQLSDAEYERIIGEILQLPDDQLFPSDDPWTGLEEE
jgi:hypothetical protein